jgi:hypothetical protein
VKGAFSMSKKGGTPLSTVFSEESTPDGKSWLDTSFYIFIKGTDSQIRLASRIVLFDRSMIGHYFTVNLGLVSMNYIFCERNLIYLHGEDKVRS